jgi:hypothetical protein
MGNYRNYLQSLSSEIIFNRSWHFSRLVLRISEVASEAIERLLLHSPQDLEDNFKTIEDN